MERASQALVAGSYFEAESLCVDALEVAQLAKDYERVARICLPLQEARRQKRQLATDTGAVRVGSSGEAFRTAEAFETGCVLLQPPMIGADARGIRETAERRGNALFVLVREPMTDAGLWPIVAVGVKTVRAKVEPPPGVERGEGITRDLIGGEISVRWFESAGEAVGDAAIASVDGSLHPAFRLDDLLGLLTAVPEHEKLHQACAEAAREAFLDPEPPGPRPAVGDPFF